MGLFDWLLPSKELEIHEENSKIVSDFSNFKKITQYIYQKSGITDLDKRALTASRLQNHAIEQKIYTTSGFLEMMEDDELFYQEVMNIATINESFFFREKRELDWLIRYIKDSSKKLDILVLPCSTGEEVYSIFLLLLEENISFDKINIYGCDLNSQAVKNAIRAEYDEHSLHNLNEDMIQKYFHKNEHNLYELNSNITSKANFFQQNIFEIDTTQKEYDIVLSRNMFIYFDDENRQKALEIIVALLKPNGIYIKGHADHIQKHPSLKNLAYGIYSKQI